jgi:F-type H+-transporting ATPase subunit epsilon
MQAKILSLEKKIFEGSVRSITVPGLLGEIEILEDHADAFFLLTKGNIKINSQVKTQITSGFCKVIKNQVTVLA